MTAFYVPDETQPSVTIGGQVVCLFPGRPYPTEIRRCIVTCTASTRVDGYIGAINPASRIFSNLFGNNNTFSPANPLPIPAGAPVYVVFANAVAGTDTATVTLQRTGETP